MRLLQRTVQPTLFLSQAGVVVKALEQHAFPPGGQKMPANSQEANVPEGVAAIAVQFVHEIGVRFVGLQVFRLSYYHRAPGRDLWEEYLGAPFDRLQIAATPVGTETLTPDQRRVITNLLIHSDPQAWHASQPFRDALKV